MFRSGIVLAVLLLTATSRASAQIIPNAPPNLGDATTALPPGPTVNDWQPRGRAAVGTTIVITGPSFRPADIVASIGAAKIPLPVRLATSTSTRIELDVPAVALGVTGPLAIGHKGTRGTVLETSYLIDVLRPALVNSGVVDGRIPFFPFFKEIDVKEFPGVSSRIETMTFGGTCPFQRSPLVGVRQRNSDFVIRLIVKGWFERAGSCQLQLGVTPIAADGSTLRAVQLSVPIDVRAPQQYVFDNTAQLTSLLAPQLVHAGVGSACNANPGAPGATGITTIGSDLQFLVRGGLTDQSCAFKTALMVLGNGVRLTEIRWRTNVVGERCGRGGTFSPTLPSSNFTLTRASVLVNPTISQPATDFFAFAEGPIVVDGVTLMTTTQPTTVLIPMLVDLQCISMAIPLQTSTGILPPTTSPQSFGIILDRIVLVGPAGLSVEALMRRG
jgi:hypothetical protein